MAKKSLITTTVAANIITIAVEGAGAITIDVAALPDDITNRALIHGLVQKVSDAAAIPKADLPDDAAEVAKVKFAAMQSVAERLAEGDWSKRSEGGAGPVAGIILRAFTEFAMERAKKAKNTDLTPEAVKAVYDAKSKSEQLALRNVPEIAAIIERIKLERGANAARQVDADALLGELGL